MCTGAADSRQATQFLRRTWCFAPLRLSRELCAIKWLGTLHVLRQTYIRLTSSLCHRLRLPCQPVVFLGTFLWRRDGDLVRRPVCRLLPQLSSASLTSYLLTMHGVLAFLLALSVLNASTHASQGTSCPDSPHQCLTVSTTNGLVTGHPATNASKVVEYLGIPYAQPPVGELRFAPPAKYSGNGSYVASNWVNTASEVTTQIQVD